VPEWDRSRETSFRAAKRDLAVVNTMAFGAWRVSHGHRVGVVHDPPG
jgi:hypothetical protein